VEIGLKSVVRSNKNNAMKIFDQQQYNDNAKNSFVLKNELCPLIEGKKKSFSVKNNEIFCAVRNFKHSLIQILLINYKFKL